jgi:L-ascorbate metabolism protein UlaG (beta-lactamase superfamily)
MLKTTYLSHSAFLFEDGAHTLAIDPFISGNPNAPINIAQLKADFIALTHAHGDHCGDAFEMSKRDGSLIIAVNELANYAKECGAEAHNMHIGGSWEFPFGRLKFTIAHHGSANAEGRYMGEPAGVLFKMGGKTIYHCGDTGLFLDMKLIGEMNSVDLMLVPIGDNFTMGIDDAVKAVEFVNPKLVVPIHYNTFPPIQADPTEFKTKVEALGKRAKVMEFGETMEL